MTDNRPESRPSPDHARGPAAPAAALERPQALKRWSADLVGILKDQETALFDGYSFKTGDITKADFTRILQKITGCGSVVELRSAIDRETGEIAPPAVHAANYCGQHTICPYCAGRIQDRRKARFREPILNAARTYKHAYLVTATIPPVPTWREDLAALLDAWKAFRRMGQVRRRRRKDGTIRETRSGGEFGKVEAGLAKVEIKRGDDSGLPHCHIHALFFTNQYFDFRVWSPEEKAKPREDRESMRAGNASKISTEWTAATAGKATGINVRKIKWRPAKRARGEAWDAFKHRRENWSFADSVYAQAREVLKYATKFESSPEKGTEKLFANDFIGIKAATYGRRLFYTYGAFRGVGGDDLIGGTCSLKENPIIYQARWQSDRYSPLREQLRPVFANLEPGPRLTGRAQALNRIQGTIRRMRGAINQAKRQYFAGGPLAPAVMMRREYLEDGGFKDSPVAMELPGYVVAAPDNPDTWEAWLDAATDQGRKMYAAARESLDSEAHFRMVGTPEERCEVEDFAARAYWRTEEYAREVDAIFRRTLVRTQINTGPS